MTVTGGVQVLVVRQDLPAAAPLAGVVVRFFAGSTAP